MAAEIYDVIVVGGGIVGLCSALRLARSGLSILLLEQVLRFTFTRPYSN